jgi:DNA-directed RNA polymerase subunit RPC12/RpoP
MEALELSGHSGQPIAIDLCARCHAFWFDSGESVRLSPASTLTLFERIGHAAGGKAALPTTLRCPRCQARLLKSHDRARDTAFEYWRCDRGHGRFITFFHFLREKSFIKTLSAKQLAELRQHVRTVNCSNCGAPIDVATGAACRHCGSPLSILDMQQAGALVQQLRDAAAPKPIDPTLPLRLIEARRQTEAAFRGVDSAEWWRSAASDGLIESGIAAILEKLK